jgi:RNase P/RNase MRP subunit p29
MKGKIVFETKKALFIEAGKNKKIIPKNIAKFQFKLPSGTIVNVDGIKLIGKPENRLKTKVRKW